MDCFLAKKEVVFFKLQATRCSAPLKCLPHVWRPLLFINRLKNIKNDPLFGNGILEILREPVNVLLKYQANIYLRCPMYFAKFPFDDQSCLFEMVLDEVLHVNMTLYTKKAAITSRHFQPSEQSYDYKVGDGIRIKRGRKPFLTFWLINKRGNFYFSLN